MKTKNVFKKNVLKNNLTLLLLALPGMAFVLLFNYAPMGGIIIAFKKYMPRIGLFESPWVGLDNFKFFFNLCSA